MPSFTSAAASLSPPSSCQTLVSHGVGNNASPPYVCLKLCGEKGREREGAGVEREGREAREREREGARRCPLDATPFVSYLFHTCFIPVRVLPELNKSRGISDHGRVGSPVAHLYFNPHHRRNRALIVAAHARCSHLQGVAGREADDILCGRREAVCRSLRLGSVFHPCASCTRQRAVLTYLPMRVRPPSPPTPFGCHLLVVRWPSLFSIAFLLAH